jgi:flagellar biosynthesis protein FlhF
VKLAVIQGLSLGRPVRIISADTQRIGAAGQLRTYADILGLPFQSVENVSALEEALGSIPSRTLTLIDTPGLSPGLLGDLGPELADYFTSRRDIDTHLVLTGTNCGEDIVRTAKRFDCFHPTRVLFTQFDEAHSYGGFYSAAVRLQKPLSYFSAGQLIPEDIEVASADFLLKPILSHLPELAHTATA